MIAILGFGLLFLVVAGLFLWNLWLHSKLVGVVKLQKALLDLANTIEAQSLQFEAAQSNCNKAILDTVSIHNDLFKAMDERYKEIYTNMSKLVEIITNMQKAQEILREVDKNTMN